MNPIVVGSLESSDCLITLTPHPSRKIAIESIVYDAYHDAIHAVIMSLLDDYNLQRVHVLCQDKGALEYTIKARLKTAILRFKEVHHES